MKRNKFVRILTMVAIGIAGLFVFSFVTMQLWNWLVPAVFGLRTITWVQALGLLVLSKILFGGFHGRGGGGRRWKRDMAERWEKMSPEERERMRAGMRGRWGCGFGHDGEHAAEQRPAV
jgi:hypothetical protein